MFFSQAAGKDASIVLVKVVVTEQRRMARWINGLRKRIFDACMFLCVSLARKYEYSRSSISHTETGICAPASLMENNLQLVYIWNKHQNSFSS